MARPCGIAPAEAVPSYSANGCVRTWLDHPATYRESIRKGRSITMPYIIAWLLGVPALVLILIWLFMH